MRGALGSCLVRVSETRKEMLDVPAEQGGARGASFSKTGKPVITLGFGSPNLI